MIDAPARMGNSRFPSIEAAPGSYVRTRAGSPA